jgi:hypothetical protein
MQIFSFSFLKEQFLISCSTRTRINIRCPALSGTGSLLSSGAWFCLTTRAWSLSRFSATDRVNSCNGFSSGAGAIFASVRSPAILGTSSPVGCRFLSNLESALFVSLQERGARHGDLANSPSIPGIFDGKRKANSISNARNNFPSFPRSWSPSEGCSRDTCCLTTLYRRSGF